MAHFAKLDDNNNVIEVHVVNNDVLDPNNEEESGIAFLTQWSEGYTNWKQTSYNGSFRKNFAVVGGIYDPIRDVFLYLKPYESWILNESKCIWEAPIEYPNDYNSYWWDETNQSWNLITFQSKEE
jgi:hypothetical protein